MDRQSRNRYPKMLREKYLKTEAEKEEEAKLR
jgi:hypothetical protein